MVMQCICYTIVREGNNVVLTTSIKTCKSLAARKVAASVQRSDIVVGY